jgi:hypothetical protein
MRCNGYLDRQSAPTLFATCPLSLSRRAVSGIDQSGLCATDFRVAALDGKTRIDLDEMCGRVHIARTEGTSRC